MRRRSATTRPRRRRAVMTEQRILRPAEPRFSQSLERGLAVLGCFDGQRSVRGIADLADELGLSRSTTHRYVVTLLELGYLEQEPNRKYRLGLRVSDLGMSALDSIALREQTRAHLQRLAGETGMTAILGVLDGNEVLCVQIARAAAGGSPQSITTHVGSRVASYATAMGKLLLAYLSDEQRKVTLDSLDLRKLAPNTITSKKRLMQELEDVRKQGMALEEQELAAGLNAIATPVYDENTEVSATIALIATGSASARDLADLHGARLQRAGNQVSTRPTNKHR
ncbi:MAG: IclR family transcriptional regulator [Solirubrobacteraceae bacterium]